MILLLQNSGLFLSTVITTSIQNPLHRKHFYKLTTTQMHMVYFYNHIIEKHVHCQIKIIDENLIGQMCVHYEENNEYDLLCLNIHHGAKHLHLHETQVEVYDCIRLSITTKEINHET